jgi:methyl-accepting chemotaxis protein
MKLKIAAKISILSIFCVVVTSVGLFFTSKYYMDIAFDTVSQENIVSSKNVVENYVVGLKERFLQAGTLIASNTSIINAVENKNEVFLRPLIVQAMKDTGAHFITVSDQKGVVIARSHSEKTGDSVMNQANVSKALAGEANVGIEPGTVVKFSLRAGCPVVQDGKIIGAVTIGISLSDFDFVDKIKSFTGLETTVFEMDTRLTTTILKDGQRVVGTKMDNPKVIDAVLTKGEDFFSTNVILGNPFQAAYWPIKDPNGKISGMYFVGKPLDVIETAKRNVSLAILLVTSALAFAMICLSWFIVRGITRPLHAMIFMLKDIAEGDGDLTKRLIDTSGTETQDLAELFNRFVSQVHTIIREVSQHAAQMNNSSEDLLSLAGSLSKTSGTMDGKSQAVAAAVEQMSSNMNTVASAMEEFSINIGTVASSTEEMSSTVSEISMNAGKAREITGLAVESTGNASHRVNDLGEAAREINKVTETITAISSQTNLLALNATIEAARAGEAGRGFAVVANEIKELAQQTARATEDIRTKIQGIQNATGTTVSEIQQISNVINEVNSIVTTIAAAVEEQSVTTREITQNLAQASSGIQEINENVTQADSVIRDVAKDVNDVSSMAGTISTNAEDVLGSSSTLSTVSDTLSSLVNKFKI